MFFPTKPAELPPAPTFWEVTKEFLGRNWLTIVLLILALIALILMYNILKAALPKGVVEEMEALRARIAEEVAVPEVPAEVALADQDVARMKLGIREMVSRNPRSVATIVKRWLLGK
jgi:flagellar biosynthesis/type III secretory pathway M-ring protein FliF/YscJ